MESTVAVCNTVVPITESLASHVSANSAVSFDAIFGMLSPAVTTLMAYLHSNLSALMTFLVAIPMTVSSFTLEFFAKAFNSSLAFLQDHFIATLLISFFNLVLFTAFSKPAKRLCVLLVKNIGFVLGLPFRLALSLFYSTFSFIGYYLCPFSSRYASSRVPLTERAAAAPPPSSSGTPLKRSMGSLRSNAQSDDVDFSAEEIQDLGKLDDRYQELRYSYSSYNDDDMQGVDDSIQ